jgi:hypothetical protein
MNYANFLSVWQYIAIGFTVLSAVTGVLIFIIHESRIKAISDYKQKYDYLGANDSKMIFYAIIGLALSLGMFINTLSYETVKLSVVWFLVRMFISICTATLIIYISHLLIKYAYPTTLEKKMRKWRLKPRTNPKTGNMMKLLSEDEEDVHLDEGMQAEENVFSVDYDVWVDEETGDIKIEKYPGHLIAYQCNSCGFKTMKLRKEEIVTAPTQSEDGEMIKYYQCNYCEAKRTKHVKVAKLSQSEGTYTLPEHMHFKEQDKVNLVSIEIHISNGKAKMYEFGSAKQASDFLKEYKVSD